MQMPSSATWQVVYKSAAAFGIFIGAEMNNPDNRENMPLDNHK
jgi:hypothetical protein